MMYDIYGEESVKEAFGGILPQPIEVFEYVNKWLPGEGELVLKAKNGRDGFKTFKKFEKWAKQNEISPLHYKCMAYDPCTIQFCTREDLIYAKLYWS